MRDYGKYVESNLMGRGIWRLAPAYDITYILNMGGVQPNQGNIYLLPD